MFISGDLILLHYLDYLRRQLTYTVFPKLTNFRLIEFFTFINCLQLVSLGGGGGGYLTLYCIVGGFTSFLSVDAYNNTLILNLFGRTMDVVVGTFA